MTTRRRQKIHVSLSLHSSTSQACSERISSRRIRLFYKLRNIIKIWPCMTGFEPVTPCSRSRGDPLCSSVPTDWGTSLFSLCRSCGKSPQIARLQRMNWESNSTPWGISSLGMPPKPSSSLLSFCLPVA